MRRSIGIRRPRAATVGPKPPSVAEERLEQSCGSIGVTRRTPCARVVGSYPLTERSAKLILARDEVDGSADGLGVSHLDESPAILAQQFHGAGEPRRDDRLAEEGGFAQRSGHSLTAGRLQHDACMGEVSLVVVAMSDEMHAVSDAKLSRDGQEMLGIRLSSSTRPADEIELKVVPGLSSLGKPPNCRLLVLPRLQTPDVHDRTDVIREGRRSPLRGRETAFVAGRPQDECALTIDRAKPLRFIRVRSGLEQDGIEAAEVVAVGGFAVHALRPPASPPVHEGIGRSRVVEDLRGRGEPGASCFVIVPDEHGCSLGRWASPSHAGLNHVEEQPEALPSTLSGPAWWFSTPRMPLGKDEMLRQHRESSAATGTAFKAVTEPSVVGEQNGWDTSRIKGLAEFQKGRRPSALAAWRSTDEDMVAVTSRASAHRAPLLR